MPREICVVEMRFTAVFFISRLRSKEQYSLIHHCTGKELVTNFNFSSNLFSKALEEPNALGTGVISGS